jgi:1,2-phenylacetyl-CoA epoxidase catalytic subunit
LKRRTNQEARRQYAAEADAVIRDLGLEVPDVTGKLRHAQE